MYYLEFARTKGSKDKKRRKKRGSLNPFNRVKKKKGMSNKKKVLIGAASLASLASLGAGGLAIAKGRKPKFGLKVYKQRLLPPGVGPDKSKIETFLKDKKGIPQKGGALAVIPKPQAKALSETPILKTSVTREAARNEAEALGRVVRKGIDDAKEVSKMAVDTGRKTKKAYQQGKSTPRNPDSLMNRTARAAARAAAQAKDAQKRFKNRKNKKGN